MKTTTPDVDGKTFGRLTVVKYVGDYRYECRCSCGATTTVKKYHLLNGDTSSCGCVLREYQASHPRVRELVGQTFAHLTVLEFVGKNKRREAIWKCRCVCGNERDVAGTNLITGTVESCGCMSDKKPADSINDGTRVCKLCSESKPLSEFHRAKQCAGGHIWQCRDCLAKKRKDHWMVWRYGITRAEYDLRCEEQGGKCAICFRVEKKLCVDHCHNSKVVRGMLCGSCNSAIGLFGENEVVLQRAIEYLRFHRLPKPALTN